MLKALIKISLASVFSNFSSGQKKVGRGKKILFGILAAYLILTILLLSSFTFISLLPTFAEKGIEWLYFAIIAVIVMILTVFGSFTIAQSLIYNSRDNDMLLAMPIKTSDILASRVFVLLFFNYIYSLLIYIPAGVVYALYSGFSTVALVIYILLSVLFPLLTTTISILFAWLLTFVATKLKNKNLISSIFAVVFLLGYMYLSFNLQNAISALASNAQMISDSVKTYLVFFYYYGIAVVDGNFLSALIFASICITPFVIALGILSKTFLILISGMRKNTVSSKKAVAITQSAVFTTLLKKEFARFISLPTYILNATIGGILSIAVAVMLLIRGTDFLFNTILPSNMQDLLPVVISTAFAFMAGMSCSTVASISLEGINIQIIKSLPINYKDFYNAKLMVNIAYGVPITLIASILSCVALKCTLNDSLIIILFPLALQIFSAVVGLSIDMRKFRFGWTNPTYPVKQSMNVLKEILLAMVASIGPLIFCFLLNKVIDYQLFYFSVIIIFFIIDILVYLHIIKSGKKYFEMMS